MAKLIYSALASADGYVEDATGGIGRAAPDEEVHRFVNDLKRPIGTYLYGRRMYETMRYWQDAHTRPGEPAAGLGNWVTRGGSRAALSTSGTFCGRPDFAAAMIRRTAPRRIRIRIRLAAWRGSWTGRTRA